MFPVQRWKHLPFLMRSLPPSGQLMACHFWTAMFLCQPPWIELCWLRSIQPVPISSGIGTGSVREQQMGLGSAFSVAIMPTHTGATDGISTWLELPGLMLWTIYTATVKDLCIRAVMAKIFNNAMPPTTMVLLSRFQSFTIDKPPKNCPLLPIAPSATSCVAGA